MDKELEIRQKDFLETNVEGKWEPVNQQLICDEDLICSDFLVILS